jgi:quercetin dioxygenase-like cupin family protein
MKSQLKMTLAAVTFTLALVWAAAGIADSVPSPAPSSQQAPVKRTVLRRVDVPHTNYEVVYALVEIPANSNAGKHTHPGTVFGYLLDGDYTVLVNGSAARKVNPGETWEVPPYVIHDEHTGSSGARILAVFTVEKGKPLTSPAPVK